MQGKHCGVSFVAVCSIAGAMMTASCDCGGHNGGLGTMDAFRIGTAAIDGAAAEDSRDSGGVLAPLKALTCPEIVPGAEEPVDARPAFVKRALGAIAARMKRGRDLLLRLSVGKNGRVSGLVIEKSGLLERDYAELIEELESFSFPEPGVLGKRVSLAFTVDDINEALEKYGAADVVEAFFIRHVLPWLARKMPAAADIQICLSTSDKGQVTDVVIAKSGLEAAALAPILDRIRTITFTERIMRNAHVRIAIKAGDVEDAKQRPGPDEALRRTFIQMALPVIAEKVQKGLTITVRFGIDSQGMIFDPVIEGSLLGSSALAELQSGLHTLVFPSPALRGGRFTLTFDELEMEQARPQAELDEFVRKTFKQRLLYRICQSVPQGRSIRIRLVFDQHGAVEKASLLDSGITGMELSSLEREMKGMRFSEVEARGIQGEMRFSSDELDATCHRRREYQTDWWRRPVRMPPDNIERPGGGRYPNGNWNPGWQHQGSPQQPTYPYGGRPVRRYR